MNFWFLSFLTLPVVVPVVIALILWYDFTVGVHSLSVVALAVKRPVRFLGALLRAASGLSASSLDICTITRGPRRSQGYIGITRPPAGFWGQVRMEPTP